MKRKLEFTVVFAALVTGCVGRSAEEPVAPACDPTEEHCPGVAVYRAPASATCIRIEGPPGSIVRLDIEPHACELAGRVMPDSGCLSVAGPASDEDHTFGVVYADPSACVTFETSASCGC